MDYYLARLAPFRRLPAEALETLSRGVRLERLSRGRSLFAEGEAPGSVWLLKTGLVKAVKFAPSGGLVTMEVVAPGRLFGMIALLDRKAYPVSAVCIRDSEAYEIPGKLFERLMREHGDFSKEVYSEIGAHLRHSQALRALAQEPVEKRLAYILYLLNETAGPELKLRREDLADMAGATAETAVRVVGDFRKRKLVSTGWKRVTVLDPRALKTLSGQD